MHYKVHSLCSQRTFLQKGSILEHQWTQVTKTSHKESTTELLQSGPLNAYIVQFDKNIKTDLLEVEILYNETGICANEKDSSSFPFIDVIPEVYGEKDVTGSITSNERFSSILRLFDFNE